MLNAVQHKIATGLRKIVDLLGLDKEKLDAFTVNLEKLKKKSEEEIEEVEMEDLAGLLRIKVKRGINLARRDRLSSDPYVIIKMGSQKLKTGTVQNNCNPEWNEEMTLAINDPNKPIKLKVYDEDTFSADDKMGDAKIDIQPFLEVNKMGFEELPDGKEFKRVTPNLDNCLSEDSLIVSSNGKLVQDMVLKLRNVEGGEVEIQLEWIQVSGSKGL